MSRRAARVAAMAGVAAGVAFGGAARGQDEEGRSLDLDAMTPIERTARLTLFVENDGAIKPNDSTDRYYTSGVKLDFALQPRFARGFADFVPLGEEFSRDRTAFGVAVTQKIFTPWKRFRSDPPRDDHPFAGYLFGSFYLQRATLDDENGASTFDQLQLDLGVVGPSALGEEAQREVHNITNERVPSGYNKQLHDEPAINVSFRRKLRVTLTGDDDALAAQIIPEYGFEVGSVLRQVVGGVVFRFGQNLPDDYGPARLDLSGSAVAGTKEGFGWEAFVRAQVRAVQHDIFLDGNTYRDSRSVDRNPLVGEFQIGFALHFNRHVEFGYSQFFETERFDTQDGWHQWGAVVLRAAWTY